MLVWYHTIDKRTSLFERKVSLKSKNRLYQDTPGIFVDEKGPFNTVF